MLQVCKILLALFLISSISASTTDKYRYVIQGRAVTMQGEPIPFAYVLVSPGPNNKGVDFTYSDRADASGQIHLQLDNSNLVKTTRVLYVTGPLLSNAITLLKPPFNEYGWLKGSVYRGHQVRIKKNGEVNIGDVPVKIFYHPVKVYLQDTFGKPLIKNADAWKGVALRVLDEKGRFLEETGISSEDIKQVVNQSESRLTIALPEGVWRVEISPDENSPWLTSKFPLSIKSSNDNLQLVLRP